MEATTENDITIVKVNPKAEVSRCTVQRKVYYSPFNGYMVTEVNASRAQHITHEPHWSKVTNE